VLEEQQHGELQDEQAGEEGPDQENVHGRDEPPTGDEGQDERGEPDDPELPDQCDEGDRQRRVDLSQDRGDQDGEAGGGQQAADPAVGAPPPGDEPARRERDTGERVDDRVSRDRRAAVEEHRDQRGEAPRAATAHIAARTTRSRGASGADRLERAVPDASSSRVRFPGHQRSSGGPTVIQAGSRTVRLPPPHTTRADETRQADGAPAGRESGATRPPDRDGHAATARPPASRRAARRSADRPARRPQGPRPRRGSVVALDDITIGLSRGSFTAIMGPSGSGKSTFLHVAAGLDRPTSGTVALGTPTWPD
jgi:hypothetical protein